MSELRRVLAPDGHLPQTTHGEYQARRLAPELWERLRAGGLVTVNEAEPGSNRSGAYHPEPYIRRTVARGFDILAISLLGWDTQDTVLLRRP